MTNAIQSPNAKISLHFRGIRDLKKEKPAPNQIYSAKLRAIQEKLVPLVTLLGKYHKTTHYSITKGGTALYLLPSSPKPSKEISDELSFSAIKKGTGDEKFAARLISLRLAKAAYAFCEALNQFGTESEAHAFLKWYPKAENSGIFELDKTWDSPKQLSAAYQAQLENLEKIPALADIWEEVRFSLPELPGLSFLPQPPESY